MRLTGETFVRFQALEEVLNTVISRDGWAGSWKQQDFLYALSIFRRGATPVLLSNMMRTIVATILLINNY